MLDTGSGYSTINSDKSSFCRDKHNNCDKYGTLDTSSTSLVVKEKGKFKVAYGGGRTAIGDFCSDVFIIGNRKVPGADFALVTRSNFNYNLLGLGYPYQGYNGYSNFAQSMVNSGLIKTTAYSLWLNSLNSASGSIIFGGFDKGKYSGNLETLPVQKDAGRYDQFYVMLEGISATVNGKSVPSVKADKFAVVIDSGYTYTYLPLYLAQPIWRAAGIRDFHEENVSPLISCDTRKNFALFFSFGSQPKRKNIRVPISQLIISNPDTNSLPHGQCFFGIFALKNGDSTTYLGETFMRSAYIVFDLENNEISLAQASNSGSSKIIELDIPGVRAIRSAEGEGQDDNQDSTENAENTQTPDDTGTDTQAAGISGTDATDSDSGEVARGKASYVEGQINQAEEPVGSDSDSSTQMTGTDTDSIGGTSLNTEDASLDWLSKFVSPDTDGTTAEIGGSKSNLNSNKLASSDGSAKKADFGQTSVNAFNAQYTGSAGDTKEMDLDKIDLASNDFFNPSRTDLFNVAASSTSGTGSSDGNLDTALSGKSLTTKPSGSDEFALALKAGSDLFLDIGSAKVKRSTTKRSVWRIS